MLFFKLSANRYDLGLSNEPLFIIIAQGTAMMKRSPFERPKLYLFALNLSSSVAELFITVRIS